MYCPVHRLYTITCGAFISRQKQMSLPSSCLGVHQWKPAVRCGLDRVFNALCAPLCTYLCVCAIKKERQYLCEHTRENNKESGRENAPDGNAAVHGDVDSRPSKGEPAGGGQDFFPLGLHSLTGSQQEAERPADRQTDWAPVHDRFKGQGQGYSCFISLQSCSTTSLVHNASPSLWQSHDFYFLGSISWTFSTLLLSKLSHMFPISLFAPSFNSKLIHFLVLSCFIPSIPFTNSYCYPQSRNPHQSPTACPCHVPSVPHGGTRGY